MKILFTICARAGSKGVKSKNSRLFLDIPISYYTLTAYNGFLNKYGNQFEVIQLALNTDSEELKQQCDDSMLEYVYIPRTELLGGDRVAKADVICDTLKKVEVKTGHEYDFVVDLDLTSPLRTVDDIYGCLNKAIAYKDANVAYSVTNSRRQPCFNMVQEDGEGYMKIIIPSQYISRQEAPKTYDMNASIYVYRREPLLNTLNQDVFDGKCVGWIMKDTAVLDIDTEEDYELMQVLAKYFFEKDSELREIYNGAIQI